MIKVRLGLQSHYQDHEFLIEENDDLNLSKNWLLSWLFDRNTFVEFNSKVSLS